MIMSSKTDQEKKEYRDRMHSTSLEILSAMIASPTLRNVSGKSEDIVETAIVFAELLIKKLDEKCH